MLTRLTRNRPSATVLLVTYVIAEREAYSRALRAQGFRVLHADGPRDALATAVRERPDVIVTQLLQPGHCTTGLDLLRWFKRNVATRQIPVMMLTSLVQACYREDAIDAGCDAYLLSPALPDRLVLEVRRLMSQRRAAVAGGMSEHLGSYSGQTEQT